MKRCGLKRGRIGPANPSPLSGFLMEAPLIAHRRNAGYQPMQRDKIAAGCAKPTAEMPVDHAYAQAWGSLCRLCVPSE
jgi:hypothetical protein